MDPATDYLINTLKNKIQEHNLRSGEVIIEVDDYDLSKTNSAEKGIGDFFQKHTLKTHPEKFEVREIYGKEAMASVRFGFSVKPDYTKIDKVFTDQDRNGIIFPFINLFTEPKYYSLNTRVYRAKLNLIDFWESGGAVLIDATKIGIIWVNDLYDTFSVEKPI